MVLDAVDTANRFVDVFVGVYILVIFLWIITSWIRLPYSLNPVQRFLHDVCDPIIRPFRRVVPPIGPLDLSPMLAIFSLVIVRELLHVLLNRLH